MKKLQLLLATVLVSIGVAITYHYFEYAVHHSITYIWDTLLNTQTHRWLVVPTCLVIGLIFFGIQHWLDPASEKHQSEGLGEMPKPTIANFAKVLFIGFFSLVAGASLGPEAILVPASMVVGGYVGVKLFKQDSQLAKLLAMVGFIALFAAFFDSFIAGMLGLLLVTKQVKLKLNAGLVILAALASVTTVLMLKVLSSSAFVQMPPYTWHISSRTLLTLVVLLVAGAGLTYSLKGLHIVIDKLHPIVSKYPWWVKGTIAALGLSALYLLGGSLVMFTGNESIIPMLQQAPSLGLAGLAWILVVKLVAISWSKTMGYRGGMIFPTVFAASVCVAFSQTIVQDVSFIYGLIAVIVGVLAANKKLQILF